MLTIQRGKQQILFNYLPGRTFDFDKKGVTSIISSVRGSTFHELNSNLVIRKVLEQAQAWSEIYRPSLRNDILTDQSRFILIDPKHVNAEIFPLVFGCSNQRCKKIFDFSHQQRVPHSKTCSNCNQGKLSQLRFVKVHRCGHIEPLSPPQCPNCRNSNNMALEDRASERISNFRWKCLTCNSKQSIFPGNCQRCRWPDSTQQRMDIEVFRSNKTHYVHSVSLINIPQTDYDAFFRNSLWHVISTAKFLKSPQLEDIKISDYARGVSAQNQVTNMISGDELEHLLDKLTNGEINHADFIEAAKKLKEKKTSTTTDLQNEIIANSGLDEEYWQSSKYDILDTIIPFEIGNYKQLEQGSDAMKKIASMGIEHVNLISDFPIILASYGFSRVDHIPNECYLQPFPIDRENGGKLPIYVDKVNADAIIFQLNYKKVIAWLQANNFNPILPQATSEELSAKAYFVKLFHELRVNVKLFEDNAEARMVMSLLHTLSHLSIKHAGLLCGLDKTSISEYIIPKTLTFTIYCNHRFGATIGALTSLFELSMTEWFTQIENERKCVYDPVCFDNGGNCHSCTHLAETSCRFFNLNLGRIYLFGGFDLVLNREIKGFFDFEN